MLLLVHVHRMDPAAAAVDDLPDLGLPLAGLRRPAVLVLPVHRLVERVTVDGPLVVVGRIEGRDVAAAAALELELAAIVDHRLEGRVRVALAVERFADRQGLRQPG
jgi:hypothetical protein